MALRTSSSAVGASAISPLRTPRERDCPTPIRLSAPAALTSPTTAQILEVPISSPTIKEAGSNIFSPVAVRVFDFGADGRRCGPRQAGGNVVRHRQIQRDETFVHPLPPVINLPPAAQLPVQVVY